MTGGIPTVSVVVNCYNGAEFLAEALDSVFAQSYADWEIVFWDNQSEDQSATIAKKYDARLRYFYAPHHTSLGAARNLAVAEACGEYIAFLDCDDVWVPRKLEAQMALFRCDPGLVVAYSDSYFIDSAGRITGRTFQKRKPFAGAVYPQLVVEDFIPLLTAVVRRDAIAKVGGFNPELHHAEDWDIFLRLTPLGSFDFVNECLAKYRIHSNSFHLRNWILMTREEIELLERHVENIRRLPDDKRQRVSRKMLSLQAKLIIKKLLKEGPLPALRGISAAGLQYLRFREQISNPLRDGQPG